MTPEAEESNHGSAPTPIPFGTMGGGRQVDAYRLTNSVGGSVVILTFGGIIQSVNVPDASGATANVTLGFDSLAPYLTQTRYFGALVGRYAGRIQNAEFELDGVTYTLAENSAPHSKHGGIVGFDKQLWTAQGFRGADSCGVRLEYLSVDGEEGYPGNLQTSVTYELLDTENTLRVTYFAQTDKPTIINLTNHAYFNLAGEGEGSILDHEAQVNASSFLPIGPDQTPLGGLTPVAGTPLDFTEPHRVGERIREGAEQLVNGRGYDHNFAVDGVPGRLNFAARVGEPSTGRTLEIWTTEPAVVFYTANAFDGSVIGASGRAYYQRAGFALEPKRFEDPAHNGDFPGTILRPGETYSSTTEYRFLP
ncbi:MAG: aldose 1-epimerase [Microbacteriaceae bacterium]|nr:aldose 1-epimerase [Microbacteriaceae bacterium]